ncbi:MAG: hypothetical protein PUB59_05140 [Firmicutes bacterium]|nr:hypothetical protein [Bacillota bacterium]
METGLDEIIIADVVASIAGRDQGKLFYVVGCQDEYVLLADGKGRPLDKPKRKKRKQTRKIRRSETRVADKLRLGDKVLNSELRRDLAYLSREMQSNNLGGF